LKPLHSLLIVLSMFAIVLVGCAPGEAPVESLGDAFGSNDAPLPLSPQQYVDDVRGAGVDHVLIDVREPWEYQDGHIAEAVNIPLSQLQSSIDELPEGTPLVLYCRSGNRSNQGAGILQRAGVTGVYDLGGIISWTRAGYPLQ